MSRQRRGGEGTDGELTRLTGPCLGRRAQQSVYPLSNDTREQMEDLD